MSNKEDEEVINMLAEIKIYRSLSRINTNEIDVLNKTKKIMKIVNNKQKIISKGKKDLSLLVKKGLRRNKNQKRENSGFINNVVQYVNCGRVGSRDTIDGGGVIKQDSLDEMIKLMKKYLVIKGSLDFALSKIKTICKILKIKVITKINRTYMLFARRKVTIYIVSNNHLWPMRRRDNKMIKIKIKNHGGKDSKNNYVGIYGGENIWDRIIMWDKICKGLESYIIL